MPLDTVEIVQETPRYVVVNKASGMLSVPGKGPEKADCVASRVRAMYPESSGPLVVHRLDMDTSGLLVLGLDAGAQRALSMQFEAREVEKAYVALVDGEVAGECGRIDEPLRLDLANRPVHIVDHIHGREAITAWRVLARETDRTRVELVPHTGRTHQLRVHCADRRGLGRPILGDRLYGDADSARRLLLHASYLSFIDPESGRRVEFRSPAPF